MTDNESGDVQQNDDFFSEGIADQGETPQDESIPAPTEELSADGETPSEEEKSPNYWQSQHDKLKAEYDQIVTQKEKIDKYGPLLEYLDDPRTLSAIEAQLSGQTAVKPQPANGRAEEASQDSPSPEDILSMDLPEPPEMPEDAYDEKAMAEYRRKDAEWRKTYGKVVRAQQQLMRQQQETYREQQQRQQAMTEAQRYMQQKYGAAPQEAAQFIQEFQNPQTQDRLYEQMFKLWKAGKSEQPAKEEPKVDADRLNRLKNGNGRPPAPGATVPGAQEVQTEENPFLFMQ